MPPEAKKQLLHTIGNDTQDTSYHRPASKCRVPLRGMYDSYPWELQLKERLRPEELHMTAALHGATWWHTTEHGANGNINLATDPIIHTLNT